MNLAVERYYSYEPYELVGSPGKIVAGKIIYEDDKDILTLSDKEIRSIRNEISMIFQEPMTSLNQYLQ